MVDEVQAGVHCKRERSENEMKTSIKNIKKIFFCFIVCIAAPMLLSGCWSRIEPRNLSLTNSALFDVTDDGEIKIIKENMRPSGESGGKGGTSGEKSSVDLVVSVGKTIAEAVRDEINGRFLFGGFIKARLLSEEFAKSGLVPTMDFLTRDHLVDETPFLAVVKGENPERVYAGDVGLSEMVGNFISDMAQTQPGTKSESVYVTTLDFLKAYFAEGRQPVMGLIEVVENEAKPITSSQADSQSSQGSSEKEYRLFYSGLAAFKDDRLVGFMDRIETRAYNFIVNELKSAVISLPDGITAAKVLKSGSDIKTEIENGQTKIDVNIKVALSIIEVGRAVETNEIPPLKDLEQEFSKLLEAEISASIKKAQQEFESDIFGFGTYVNIQHPNEWEDMKSNWDELFSNATVNVKVNSTITMSGETERSLRMEQQTHDK
jgi:spore germination protein KC